MQINNKMCVQFVQNIFYFIFNLVILSDVPLYKQKKNIISAFLQSLFLLINSIDTLSWREKCIKSHFSVFLHKHKGIKQANSESLILLILKSNHFVNCTFFILILNELGWFSTSLVRKYLSMSDICHNFMLFKI